MAYDNRGNYHSQPPPIYTVSGAYADNVNYGFYPAPPPKYEDAVRGTTMEQPHPAHGGPQPGGVVLVSPAYTYQKRKNLVSSLLLLFFSIAFLVYIFVRFW